MEQSVCETTDSSTDKRKLNQNQQNVKKRKKFDSGCKNHQDAANYLAETYFNRIKNFLSADGFEKFIKILCDYEEKPLSSRDEGDLYQEIRVLFESEGREDLSEQFVVFIRPHIAKQIEKYNGHTFLHKAWSLFSGIDNHHFSKMLNMLESLTLNPNVKVSDIESSLRPLFKGQTNLLQTICQLFASTKPPPRDVNEYETVLDISCDKDIEFEHVWVPRTHTDRSCPGQLSCQCVCHTATTKPLCSACNIRFINGRIYVQRGKEMRSARVHFSYGVSSDEMQHRLHPAYFAQQQVLNSSHHGKHSPSKGEKKERKNSQGDGICKTVCETKCENDKTEGKINSSKTEKVRSATPPQCATPPRGSSSPHVFYEENSQGYLEFFKEESDIEDEDIDLASDSEVNESQPSSSDPLSSPIQQSPQKTFGKQLSNQLKSSKPSAKRSKKFS